MSWPDSDDLVSSTVNHTAARAGPNAYTTVFLRAESETPGRSILDVLGKRILHCPGGTVP